MYLKSNELDRVRQELITLQQNKCILCERDFVEIADTPCVDHDHKTGVIRAVLCRNCNGLAGKIEQRANRAKQHLTSLEWLNNFNKYMNMQHTEYLHPNNAPKIPKLGKRLFNKLFKHNPELEYPKSGKITKPIQKTIDEMQSLGLL